MDNAVLEAAFSFLGFCKMCHHFIGKEPVPSCCSHGWLEHQRQGGSAPSTQPPSAPCLVTWQPDSQFGVLSFQDCPVVSLHISPYGPNTEVFLSSVSPGPILLSLGNFNNDADPQCEDLTMQHLVLRILCNSVLRLTMFKVHTLNTRRKVSGQDREHFLYLFFVIFSKVSYMNKCSF